MFPLLQYKFSAMSNFSTQFTFKIEIENSMCEITLAKSKGHIVIKIACPKSPQSLISISSR